MLDEDYTAMSAFGVVTTEVEGFGISVIYQYCRFGVC